MVSIQHNIRRSGRALLLSGAALATLAGTRLTLDAMVIRPDGGALHRTSRVGAAADAHAMGEDAGRELRGRAGPDFFAGPR